MDSVFRIPDIPWWYYAIAVLIAVIVSWKWRWEGGLLAGYAFVILAGTLLIRKPYTGNHLRLEPLWSWRVWKIQKEQILTNIIMFIPFGFLVGRLWKWKGLLAATIFSLTIEVLQLVTSLGLCELDDVLHNTLGAAIGVGIAMTIKWITRKQQTERDRVEQ